jgi:hypothetical protein
MHLKLNEYYKRFDELNVCSHDSVEMKTHMDFTAWAKDNGCIIHKTKLVVYATENRGLQASVDIPQDDVVVTVPEALFVNRDKVILNQAVKKLMDSELVKGKWTTYVFIAIYMMEESINPKSAHKRWLDVIPKQGNCYPLLFDEEQLKWLAGSNIPGRKVGSDPR